MVKAGELQPMQLQKHFLSLSRYLSLSHTQAESVAVQVVCNTSIIFNVRPITSLGNMTSISTHMLIHVQDSCSSAGCVCVLSCMVVCSSQCCLLKLFAVCPCLSNHLSTGIWKHDVKIHSHRASECSKQIKRKQERGREEGGRDKRII